MVRCALILHHADGRIEETDVRGDGFIQVGSLFRLPASADHWWKVVSLRWPGDGGAGVADLEPTELPEHLVRNPPMRRR